MDAQRIHLMSNYYPVILTAFGIVFLLAGYWWRSARVKRIALKVFIAAALVSLPAFVTGEIGGPAAAAIASPSHVSALANHKNTARISFLILEATGIAALIGLVLYGRRPRAASYLTITALVLSFAAFAFIGYTTHLGRQIKWAGMAAAVLQPVQTLTINTTQEHKLWHA